MSEEQEAENIISQTAFNDVKKIHPDFELPANVKIVPDNEIESHGVQIVISSRYSLRMMMAMGDLKWHKDTCFNCGHAIIVSDSSPRSPAHMCTICALKEGRIPNEWIEPLSEKPE